MPNRFAVLLSVVFPYTLAAQESETLQRILDRIESLERQNAELTREVQALRQQVGGPKEETTAATVPERLDVQESRTEELAQTKVEASQKLPISITGMVLFNAFLNSGSDGGQENPTIAVPFDTPRTGGGSFRQTVLGLQFHSPRTVWGAQVKGSLYVDFFATQNTGPPPFRAGNDITDDEYQERASGLHLNQLARLRIATVDMEWKTRTLTFGQDKPIISVREPTSLAQVGVSPLTNAGNPWLWQPQIRFEQRWTLSEGAGLRAQIGIFQTAETAASIPGEFVNTLESSRPGLEGRIVFRQALSTGGHFEIAPGFHLSTTHVAATSVPSRLYTLDWSISPITNIDFTGLFYSGENTAHLGTLRQGFTIFELRSALPVHSLGGWGQIAYTATPRLSFHIFGGQQDDRNRDLRFGGVSRNLAYAGNAMYRIAPNVILSFEAMQIRTTYIGAGTRLINRHDLALAYQF